MAGMHPACCLNMQLLVEKQQERFLVYNFDGGANLFAHSEKLVCELTWYISIRGCQLCDTCTTSVMRLWSRAHDADSCEEFFIL